MISPAGSHLKADDIQCFHTWHPMPQPASSPTEGREAMQFLHLLNIKIINLTVIFMRIYRKRHTIMATFASQLPDHLQ